MKTAYPTPFTSTYARVGVFPASLPFRKAIIPYSFFIEVGGEPLRARINRKRAV